VYIDVLPIRRTRNTYIMGEGKGRVVEYAVKMRRLPDEMLMKSLFIKGKLKDEHLKKLPWYSQIFIQPLDIQMK